MKNRFGLGLGLAAGTLVLVAGWWLGQRPPALSITSTPAASVAPVLPEPPPPDEASLLALSERDPLAAIRLASTFLRGVAFDRVLAAALDKLLQDDPAAAAAIIAALPSSDFQRVVAGRAARLWAQIDPPAALTWAQSLGDGAARLRATREVFGTWAQADPAAASRALAPLVAERENALSALAVMTSWIPRDPATALAWGKTLPSAAARNLVLTSAVQTWSATDAGAALTWLQHQPPAVQAEIDAPTLFAVLRDLAQQDPAGAKACVRAAPIGAEQTRAAAAISPVLARADPLAAMEWALSLEHPATILAAFTDAYRAFRAVDPDEAQRILAASDLSPEEKHRLVDYP